MPVKIANYQNGLIYKISRIDGDTSHEYYGSTCNIRVRRGLHKSCCHNIKSKAHNYKVYQHIRQTGGWSAYNVFFVESFPSKSKQELEVRERYWIESLRPTLNCNIPGRTQSEWEKANPAKMKIKNEKQKILRNIKIACECGSIISKRNISTHKKTKIHSTLLFEKKKQTI